MAETVNRFRLRASAALVWWAAKLAPRPMDQIFHAYLKMLEAFPNELARGRTFGVVMAPWYRTDEGALIANRMAIRAGEAVAIVRSSVQEP